MKFEIEITPRQFADQMVAAIEGGSTHWCNQIELLSPTISTTQADGSPWYDQEAVWSHPDLQVEVIYDDHTEIVIVRQADIKRGLELMAHNSPQHFASIFDESGDAETGDVLLQYVVLKEIVYG